MTKLTRASASARGILRSILLVWCIIVGLDKQTCSAQTTQELIRTATGLVNSDQYDSASTLLDHAFARFNDSTSELLIANGLLLRGRIGLTRIGPMDGPTRYFLESLALFTKNNDSNGIARCNLQLGVVNYDLKNYKVAIDYLKKTIEFSISGEPRIGIAHYLMGISYSEIREFTIAEDMFDLALRELGKNSPIFRLQVESFRANMYVKRGDVKLALTRLQEQLVTYARVIELEGFAPIYAFLSNAYLRDKQYEPAIGYARKTVGMTKEDGSATIYYRLALNTLHNAYSALDNGDSAYYFLNELSTLKDSISNSQTLQKVAELRGKFEFENMMNQQLAEQELKDAIAVKELERTKVTRNFLIGAFLFAILVAALFLNQKNRLSKEKSRSDDLLLNILPHEIAQELKDHGKAKARKYDQVSILFTDFKEFTSAAERLSPEELVDEINVCFEAFDSITEKFNVEKIKTIGDAYMAAGGLPIPTADSVKKTVLAAIAMQEFIEERRKIKGQRGELAFEMRIGIHTGPVVAGIVGKKKFQYDTWGDTVNTASRIESMGMPGKINISKVTYDLLKSEPDLVFENRGKLHTKGKGDLGMWFVKKKVKG